MKINAEVKCFLKGCFLSRTVLFTTGIGWLCWKTTLKNSGDESHISWLLSQYQIIKNQFMDMAMQAGKNLLEGLN